MKKKWFHIKSGNAYLVNVFAKNKDDAYRKADVNDALTKMQLHGHNVYVEYGKSKKKLRDVL